MNAFEISLLKSYESRLTYAVNDYNVNDCFISFKFPVKENTIEIPLFFSDILYDVIYSILTKISSNNIKNISYILPSVVTTSPKKTFKGAYNNRPKRLEELYKIIIGTELYYLGSSFILDKDFKLLMCLTLDINYNDIRLSLIEAGHTISCTPKCLVDYSVITNPTLVNKGIINNIIKIFSTHDLLNYLHTFQFTTPKAKIIIEDLSYIVNKAIKPENMDLDKNLNNFLLDNIESIISNPRFVCL